MYILWPEELWHKKAENEVRIKNHKLSLHGEKMNSKQDFLYQTSRDKKLQILIASEHAFWAEETLSRFLPPHVTKQGM